MSGTALNWRIASWHFQIGCFVWGAEFYRNRFWEELQGEHARWRSAPVAFYRTLWLVCDP